MGYNTKSKESESKLISRTLILQTDNYSFYIALWTGEYYADLLPKLSLKMANGNMALTLVYLTLACRFRGLKAIALGLSFFFIEFGVTNDSDKEQHNES